MQAPERSKRLKPARALARQPRIVWHSRFAEPYGLQCVTIFVDGSRYEYTMLALAADNAEYLFKHISAGKGLAYVKRHNQGWIKL